MSNYTSVLAAAVGACIAVSACTAAVTNRENMLAAAGFTLLPADTVERSTALASLPPHKFIHQVRNGRVVFVYADAFNASWKRLDPNSGALLSRRATYAAIGRDLPERSHCAQHSATIPL